MTPKSGEQEQNINADTIFIGTYVIKLEQSIVVSNWATIDGEMVTTTPGPAANDHEARTRKIKPRVLKYTQPK